MDEYHHVYTQKAHSEYKDKTWNMAPVCRLIHQEWHQCGTKHMIQKYAGVKLWMFNNGWRYCDVRDRWVH